MCGGESKLEQLRINSSWLEGKLLPLFQMEELPLGFNRSGSPIMARNTSVL